MPKYVTYLLSTTVAVMIFYIFYAIAFNQDFVALSNAHDSVKIAFVSSAVVVAVFSIAFVWFSSNFFIRTRKKEIGTYSLLGMTKKQIARMFFYESLTLGLFSLVTGVILGVIFSKLFGMLLIYMMGQTTQIRFEIVPMALEVTSIVFFGLFLLNALHGYSLIYRFKLIELFRADKEGERVPRGSILQTIISLLLIFSGYYLAWYHGREIVILAIPILILVIPGTFMLFNNAIVFLIHLLRQRKQIYFRGVNLIGISQLLFRIKGNARMLAIIATLSAVTISAVGTSITLYLGNEEMTQNRMPYSLLYEDNPSVEQVVAKQLTAHPEAEVQSVDHLRLLKATAEISRNSSRPTPVDVYVISAGQYRQAAVHQNSTNTPLLSLPNNNECLISDILPSNNLTIVEGDRTWSFSPKGKPVRNIINVGMARNITITVSDQQFNKMVEANPGNILNMTGIMLRKPQALAGIFKTTGAAKGHMTSSFYDSLLMNKQFFGILTYIGTFLGVLFFLATGSIIYFKQLMEANDDRQRYLTLRYIGISKKELRETVQKQLFVIFALPLVVGIVHSFFALSVIKQLLNIDILEYGLIVTTVYVLLYICYYFVTVNSFTQIVMGRNSAAS